MSNGTPTPWEVYAIAPYQYPLVDMQPVVRIPVVGPEPFNTLVVVRGRVSTTVHAYGVGKLERRRVIVGTNFSLAGFDQRVPPPFAHSTAVALQMIQTSDDSPFFSAVDQVDGFFDYRGNWVLQADVADLWDHVIAASTAYVSSWVLCYEPPLPEAPRGNSVFGRLTMPPAQWTLERQATYGSNVGGEFERSWRRKARRETECGAEGPHV